MNLKKIIGPGTLITAAFIGPGTLTICTVAGVEFGYQLVWVLVIATFATIVLQGMAARLGVVTGMGLGEALRQNIKHPVLKILGLGLVFVAIIIGNAAYEMGNITGAMLGLQTDSFDYQLWSPLILGLIVGAILWKGNLQTIQKIMGVLVLIMSLIFVSAAIMVGSFNELFQGLIPSMTLKNQLTALALAGTTIVPYNLFLHASATSEHWSGPDQLPAASRETIVTIAIGGLISICVLVTAASGAGGLVQGITDMSRPLEPILGSLAKPFISAGIFAAGVSSSLTAPYAAELTARGIFGWTDQWKPRIIWLTILVLGVAFSMLGFRPISVIKVAQIANGIMLPVVVVFLISACNSSKLMGKYRNTTLQNILGGLVFLVSLVISIRSFNSVFHFL